MSANRYLSETTIEQVHPSLIIALTANNLVEWASCPFLYPFLHKPNIFVNNQYFY
ncbi:MAG: hypothetical protein F6K17_38845 [Okeania sp. SIO3C4]|nr:hypothetical protein [Okeania sp. SIO3C4]